MVLSIFHISQFNVSMHLRCCGDEQSTSASMLAGLSPNESKAALGFYNEGTLSPSASYPAGLGNVLLWYLQRHLGKNNHPSKAAAYELLGRGCHTMGI